MESLTGKFRTRRYQNTEGIGIFLVIIGIITFFIVSDVIIKSTSDQKDVSPLWSLLTIPAGVAIAGAFVIVNSKVDKKREIELTFSVDTNGMSISNNDMSGMQKIVATNLLWKEVFIVEYSLGGYYRYSEFQREVKRYIRLRLWNSREQVMLVEDLPDGWNPGYPIQTLTTSFDYPNYFSVIPGTLEKVERMLGEKPENTDKVWC